MPRAGWLRTGRKDGAPENTRHAAAPNPRRQAVMLGGRRNVMKKWLEAYSRLSAGGEIF